MRLRPHGRGRLTPRPAIGTQFSISSKTCGSALSSGSSCSVTVDFSPTAVGPQTDLLKITDNTSGVTSPQLVPLAGVGVIGGGIDAGLPSDAGMSPDGNSGDGSTDTGSDSGGNREVDSGGSGGADSGGNGATGGAPSSAGCGCRVTAADSRSGFGGVLCAAAATLLRRRATTRSKSVRVRLARQRGAERR
jgi:hypothetical protein